MLFVVSDRESVFYYVFCARKERRSNKTPFLLCSRPFEGSVCVLSFVCCKSIEDR